MKLIGNSKNDALYIDWLVENHGNNLIANGFTDNKDMQRERLRSMFNHGSEHINPHKGEEIKAYAACGGGLLCINRLHEYVAEGTKYQSAYFSDVNIHGNITPTINAQSLDHDGMPAQFKVKLAEAANLIDL